MVPVQAPGEEVRGVAEVHGEAEVDLEALAPEAAEATQVRQHEGVVGAVAQDAPINT